MTAVTLAIAGIGVATAAPALPDFRVYPKADAHDYVVRGTKAPTVSGFTTPEAVFCTSSTHRGVSTLDCVGPLPGAPHGANSVHLSRSGDVIAPVTFAPATAVSADVGGHRLRSLPTGVNYAADNVQCLREGVWQLVCVMENGSQRHGFVITAGKTEGF